MILEYKRTKEENEKIMDIYRGMYFKEKGFMYKLNKIIAKVKNFFIKDNGKRRIELLEDSINIFIKDNCENINYKNIINLEEIDEFLFVELKGNANGIYIPIRAFKDINQFKEIINSKTNIDLNKKEYCLEGSGILEGNINFENLDAEEINKRIYRYKMKKCTYKNLARASLNANDQRKYKLLKYFVAIFSPIIIIEIFYQFEFYIIYILLILVMIGVLFPFKNHYFKKENDIGRCIKKNIADGEIEFEILKTQEGILYSVNGKKEFYSKEKIDTIEKRYGFYIIRIKDSMLPITIINIYDYKNKNLINELEDLLKENPSVKKFNERKQISKIKRSGYLAIIIIQITLIIILFPKF